MACAFNNFEFHLGEQTIDVALVFVEHIVGIIAFNKQGVAGIFMAKWGFANIGILVVQSVYIGAPSESFVFSSVQVF